MSNNIIKADLWLIGSGLMALEYFKVLIDLKISFIVIGRSIKSTEEFKQKTNFRNVFSGGIDSFKKQNFSEPKFAINAVNVENLKSTTLQLLDLGIKNILVEKPGGLNGDEIQEMLAKAKFKDSNIFIAYNRRFFSSTLKALEIIKESGKIISFHFDFTEWSHEIVKLPISEIVKSHWLLANSSHVIDLAFFFGGIPESISCFKSGSLEWHQAGSIFVGSGKTKTNTLFSYHANWEAPGRWSLELLTNKFRLIFKPFEQLHIQKTGSVAIEKVEIDDALDKKYKPGLYLQIKAFLFDQNDNKLVTLADHFENIREIYDKILNA